MSHLKKIQLQSQSDPSSKKLKGREWSVGRWACKSGSNAAGSTWHHFRKRGPKTKHAKKEKASIHQPQNINALVSDENYKALAAAKIETEEQETTRKRNHRTKLIPPSLTQVPKTGSGLGLNENWNFDSHYNCLIPESKAKIPESEQTSMDCSSDREGKAKRTHLKSNDEQE